MTHGNMVTPRERKVTSFWRFVHSGEEASKGAAGLL